MGWNPIAENTNSLEILHDSNEQLKEKKTIEQSVQAICRKNHFSA
jgi:hypothetical protein